jgi:hypothetical protein
MPSAGLEPVIPANERPQANALDRSATGLDITPDIQVCNLHYKVRVIIN